MGNYSVYKHTSPSGKVYIGITKRKPEYRWNNGKGYSERNQPLFARAIKKYGWDNITHEILYEELEEQDAKNIEISLIQQYKVLKMSYNITDGGDGTLGAGWTHTGWKHSETTKKKMSRDRKGTRIGKDNPMYGRHKTSAAYGKFGKKHPASKEVYQYSKDGTFIKKWECMTTAAIALGYTQKSVTHITACCNGRIKSALGYIWKRETNK